MNSLASAETFDILERWANDFPEISGAFARGTGGVDIDFIVRFVDANFIGKKLTAEQRKEIRSAVMKTLAERNEGEKS